MSDSDRADDDLAAVAEDLAVELRRLREELESRERRDPPRGPLGIPRPPRPREFLEFADEVAIPGFIAILEANVKLLEALQRAIRLADSRRRAGERSREVGSGAAERAGRVSRRALEGLQDGMDDLRTAIEGGAVPEDRVGGDLLADIDRLQREIEDRIEDAQRDRQGGGRGGDGGDGSVGRGTNGTDDRGVEIDVDAELDSLRERYGEDPADESGESGGDPGEEPDDADEPDDDA